MRSEVVQKRLTVSEMRDRASEREEGDLDHDTEALHVVAYAAAKCHKTIE